MYKPIYKSFSSSLKNKESFCIWKIKVFFYSEKWKIFYLINGPFYY